MTDRLPTPQPHPRGRTPSRQGGYPDFYPKQENAMNSSTQEALAVARAQIAAVTAKYQEIDAQRTRAAEAIAKRDEVVRLRQGAEDQLRRRRAERFNGQATDDDVAAADKVALEARQMVTQAEAAAADAEAAMPGFEPRLAELAAELAKLREREASLVWACFDDQLRAAGEKYAKALDALTAAWAEVLACGEAMTPFANASAGRMPLVTAMTPRRIEVRGLYGAGPDLEPGRTYRDVSWSDVLARAAQLRAQIGAL